MAEAIQSIQHSDLVQAEIETLEALVDALRAELEEASASAWWLDGQLTKVREQRDAAEAELHALLNHIRSTAQ